MMDLDLEKVKNQDSLLSLSLKSAFKLWNKDEIDDKDVTQGR